jgi:Flp pilus assembly protein TadD
VSRARCQRRSFRRSFAIGAILFALAGRGAAGPGDDARELLRDDQAAAAERLLLSHLRAHPDDADTTDALDALGEVERKRCRLGLAEAAFVRALERDAADPAARAGLAEVLLLSGHPDDALAQAQMGIDELEVAGRKDDGRPWRMKALSLVELRRYDPAMDAARRAVTLRPDDARCSECLAAVLFRMGDMPACRTMYLRAVALDPRVEEANLRLGNGFGPECTERPWVDGEDASAFRDALAAWDRGDLADAEARFLDLLRRRPDSYKYRLGLGLARLAIRRRGEAWLGGDATKLYARLPAPELEGIEKLVPGYAKLGEVERHVVRVAAAPARLLIPKLLAAGATHEAVPIESDLTDSPLRAEQKTRLTFDGRWYAHLRGVGGANGATGTEKIREAAEFAFNTFAHELGHQVHRVALDKAQQDRVTALYASAKSRNGFLDYYAASNADEYFAQGYEAFVSPLKRGCLTETARHTRTELSRRDPDLLAFLREILDTSYESEETLDAIVAAARGEEEIPRPEPAAR